jgi:hypothetical protein
MNRILIVVLSIIAGVILAAISSWFYDLLKARGVLPERPTLKKFLIILLGLIPLVALVALPALLPNETKDGQETQQPTLTIAPIQTLSTSSSSTLTIGQNFEGGCIDSKYWTPYQGENRPKDFKGCWDLSTMGISAQDGGLLIAADNVEGYTRSISTTLPAKAEVQFTVRIDKLSTLKNVDSSIVFGIGNTEEWFLSGKYLVYRVISPNSPVYMFFTDSVLKSGETFFPNYTYGQEQKIVFSINGLLLDLDIDGSKVLESVALSPSDRKVFWIGSWVSNNGSIRVFVRDFRVIEK